MENFEPIDSLFHSGHKEDGYLGHYQNGKHSNMQKSFLRACMIMDMPIHRPGTDCKLNCDQKIHYDRPIVESQIPFKSLLQYHPPRT